VILWDLMVIMGFHGDFMGFHGDFMGFHGDFMGSSDLVSSDSSHLCFSTVHIVGSFTSKYSSITLHYVQRSTMQYGTYRQTDKQTDILYIHPCRAVPCHAIACRHACMPAAKPYPPRGIGTRCNGCRGENRIIEHIW